MGWCFWFLNFLKIDVNDVVGFERDHAGYKSHYDLTESSEADDDVDIHNCRFIVTTRLFNQITDPELRRRAIRFHVEKALLEFRQNEKTKSAYQRANAWFSRRNASGSNRVSHFLNLLEYDKR